MRNIARKVSFEDLVKAHKFYYGLKPREIPALKQIHEKISAFQDKIPLKNEEIEICLIRDEDFEIYCVDTGEFSLSFRPWREISNLVVSKGTLDHYKIADILCHYIYEITFYGPEENMEKKKKEFIEAIKEHQEEEIRKNKKK